jgi:para-aminobenzoate synthetase component I
MIIFTQIKTNFLTSLHTIFDQINKHSIEKIPFFLLVDFDMKQMQFYTIQELEKTTIQIQFPAFRYCKKSSKLFNDIQLKAFPMSIDMYKAKFETVMKHLQYGNTYLTNLTAETPVQTRATLEEIFHSSKATYKILYKNEWVCFSPETFIKIKNGKIYSHPMKGTIDASIENAKEIILHDKKEIAEHYTIVDLIRNDISQVATNVQVKRFRYIDEIETQHKTLLQVSSEVVGDLPTNYKTDLASILFKLLPAGSISGAPKTKTIDIIREAENYKRGFYTGVAFYFDGETIDSCVLIRFIEQKGNEWVYKSGGGITTQSEMEKEYEELIQQIYVPIV